jgi:hypothetical protein
MRKYLEAENHLVLGKCIFRLLHLDLGGLGNPNDLNIEEAS